MTFEPLYSRIMVLMQGTQEELSRGGIIIPEAAQEKPQVGTVMAVGPGRIRDDGTTVPRSVRVGDKVILGKYSGSVVKIDGTPYMILDEQDVLGILRD